MDGKKLVKEMIFAVFACYFFLSEVVGSIAAITMGVIAVISWELSPILVSKLQNKSF